MSFFVQKQGFYVLVNEWSEVEFDPGQPEPECQGSLVRFTSEDKQDRNRILLAHLSDREKCCRLTVRMSYDECRSWPVAKVVTEGRAGYSDLAVTADDTILCLYETRAGVVLARFDVSWLTNGADGL
jgi:sialidase-1